MVTITREATLAFSTTRTSSAVDVEPYGGKPMEESEVKVKRWSFCPDCKGRGMNLPNGCSTCNSTGRVSELVLLEDIPKGCRWEYRQLQADFIKKQLDRKVKV